MRRVTALALLGVLATSLVVACEPTPHPEAGVIRVTRSVRGDDWSLPSGTSTAPNSGFFSEESSPSHHIDTHVVDVTWRMVEPEPDTFVDDLPGGAEGDAFASLEDQLEDPGPFWLRVWISNVDWAPDWVVDECDLEPAGVDESGQEHLPVWDPCFWGHARDLYEHLLVDLGLRDDSRLRFVYVPGAFAYTEFDFDVMNEAVAAGTLDLATFDTWFGQAIDDLAAMMGDDVGKLVYTGEDYPFGPFGAADDLYALAAAEEGMGVRTGISELANFHLNQVPAYGTTIGADGHLVTDDEGDRFAGDRVTATEHECFRDCGFFAEHLYYAIKQANLRALALRTNWMYVRPVESYLDRFGPHWAWVRRSLGQTVETSPDAWVALRKAEDTYWADDDAAAEAGVDWDLRPFVRNVERWVVQRDDVAGCASRRGSEVHDGEIEPENGIAFEGRRTDAAHGNPNLCFAVDDRFLDPSDAVSVEVKVTYVDRGSGTWRLVVPGATGPLRSPVVRLGDTGTLRTVTFAVDGGRFDGSLPGGVDFRVRRVTGNDVDVQFVRVVKP